VNRRVTKRTCRLALVFLATVIAGCNGGASDGEDGSGGAPLDDPALIEINNRGVGLMGKFEYEAARVAFAEALAGRPGWLDAKVNLAIALFNRQRDGDEAEGLRLLQEVIAADPDHLRGHYCIGILLLRNGESEAAITHFRRVVAMDPDDGYAAYNVAQCVETEDKEAALAGYERAIAADPYLRSAYYRAFQMQQRLGRAEEARAYFDAFQRLETNPQARLMRLQYGRMGPKAMAVAVDPPGAAPRAPVDRPPGPNFAPAVPLIAEETLAWGDGGPDAPPTVTACDIDGDGLIDVFITNALREPGGVVNAVAMNRGDAGFVVDTEHALARIAGVTAVAWGDVDNDGLTDVYLGRRGPNQLHRQVKPGRWVDVTEETGTGGGAASTVDVVLVDADHDGDLDVFCVNGDGPNELFSNNLDGTFRAVAAELGIAGEPRGSRQALFVDLDADRDLDIIVVNDQRPHDVYVNDRLWRYTSPPEMRPIRLTDMTRVVAGDRDADGRVELYSVRPSGGSDDADVAEFARVFVSEAPAWEPRAWGPKAESTAPVDHQIALLDVDGGGRSSILVTSSTGWATLFGDYDVVPVNAGGPVRWTPVLLDDARGPSVVGILPGAAPRLWAPGSGRFPFATLSFSGRTDKGDSLRSNASGLGTRVAARIGSRWVVVRAGGGVAGPGRSLQPIGIGLGGADGIDFVAIDWSDGVFQTEIALPAGPALVTETQRQLSSCPVLFAWNGRCYEFVTDFLGVGGLGYLVAPGEYAPPRPWERLLLPPDVLAAKDGQYRLKLSEPMEEACYLDAARLAVYDLPPGWDMVIDDRMRIAGPEPTGEPRFYREERLPVRATNDRGDDVTAQVTNADHVAAPVGAIDRRFIGRLERDHEITLEFTAPIEGIGGDAGVPTLVIDGWVEYPYSQTMFAAWQAGADYRAPTLSARGADGRWRVVIEQFGYPAGMPRRMSLPMAGLPGGTTALRLTTNQEIYWDRIAVVGAEPCPAARRHVIQAASARLARTGFAERTTGPQRLPSYDYDRRAPVRDTRHQAGFYTAIGPMAELIAETDDVVAIFGPGEEIDLAFPAPPPPPAGTTRRFVLEADGWCKDMDLFTRDGETIEPLPARGAPTRRSDLHERFNTRYESGR